MVLHGNAKKHNMDGASELEQLELRRKRSSRTPETTLNRSKTPKTLKEDWTKEIKKIHNGNTPNQKFY